MKFLFLTLLASSFTAQAAMIKTNVCYSECLGIDVASRSLSFLGNLQSSGSSNFGAWKELSQSCVRKARKYGLNPVLASGSVVYDYHVQSGGSSSYSSSFESVRTFGYARVSGSTASASSYYFNEDFKLEVTLATPKASCHQEMVDEDDLTPYYDGDLPVQG
jgi:hypothetical protein